jgi:adenylate cyclase
MKNSQTQSVRNFRIGLIVLAIALLILADRVSSRLWELPTPIERLELYLVDAALRLRGTQIPSSPIVIVTIDDNSLNYTGYHWPWPRTYLAEIINSLNNAGARVIGFDIMLFGNDPDPAGDEALAKAFANADNVVAVMNITRSENTETLELPIDPYPKVLAGLGIAGIIADNDAIIRSVQAYDHSAYDDQVYFNWAFETSRLYLGVDPPQGATPDHLDFNSTKIPLQNGRLSVNFNGPPETFMYYPAFQVVLGDFPAATFKDKIILIGATSVTLQDIYPVPFSTSKRMPGVEVTANAIDTILAGHFIYVAPPMAGMLILLLTAVFTWLISRRRQPASAIFIMFGAMALFGLVWFFLYTQRHWQFELASPELMLMMGILIPSFDQALSQELEKRRMQKLFGQFVSPEIVSQLMKTPDILSLHKRANLTILFSDIRNFTNLSEKLSPDEVVGMLNPYLEVMTKVVHKHGGTVDKYIGDAIVAFYGEPISYNDHTIRAVRTAIEMRVELNKLRKTWLEEGRFDGVFDIGIGIHTGDVFVGMIGSQQRLNYTVIGDVVNTAARLQDQTKFHAWPILISGQVYDIVKGEIATEFVEERLFKGKQEPVMMYKVLGIE